MAIKKSPKNIRPRSDHHRPEPEGVSHQGIPLVAMDVESLRVELVLEIGKRRNAEAAFQQQHKKNDALTKKLKQANEKLRYLKIMWPEIMVSLRSLEAMERGRNR